MSIHLFFNQNGIMFLSLFFSPNIYQDIVPHLYILLTIILTVMQYPTVGMYPNNHNETFTLFTILQRNDQELPALESSCLGTSPGSTNLLTLLLWTNTLISICLSFLFWDWCPTSYN